MASRKRRTEHKFSMVPKSTIPRSVFNRSHSYKSMFNAGLLIPFYVDEALPGDTFKVKVSAFARMATPIYPIMDNAYMDFFFFAVPNRLLWLNWEKFQGAQDDPGDSIDFTIPQVESAGSIISDSIFDYMGLPSGAAGWGNNVNFSALPSRAYARIWNEWFRDENLQDSIVSNTTNGPDSITGTVLMRRGKRHDYFTSCLPSPQKGAGISLPLGTSATVLTSTTRLATGAQEVMTMHNVVAGADPTTNVVVGTGVSLAPEIRVGSETATTGTAGGLYPSNLYADLTNATAATINSLREAFQLQRLLERDARGGTRYTEIIKSHFQITSPDFRQQRPEYLGGGTAPVIITAVPQTSQTATTPQGTQSAFGTVAVNGIGFRKSFTEHCTIIGLVCVRADLSYQQGMSRMWNRSTRYDFYIPALAHLGEQGVRNAEIYFQGDDHLNGADIEDDLIFGYQERWAEYRYFPSLITSTLRSTHATNVDEWHLAQQFSTIPLLDSTFIQETPPFDRIIATQDEPHFVFDSFIEIQAARPMPIYSVPGYIDHF